jgi:damage-control phosphatase, subfamily I
LRIRRGAHGANPLAHPVMMMRIEPDCIPCMLKMAIFSMRVLGLDEPVLKEKYGEISKLPSLRGENWDLTSPEVIESVMRILMKDLDNNDPFGKIKREQNEWVLGIEPFLENLIEESPDPLFTAVKLAILGNGIDFMMGEKSKEMETGIADKLNAPVSRDLYTRFGNRLKASERILYFGDNAGEIVFDKLLIRTIQKQFGPEIVFVVRSVPTLNDATIHEAEYVGMGKLVPVKENGMDGPLPGTKLTRCSHEVNDLVRRADLIISKGGGNFDSLSEETKAVTEKTTFMLLSKCDPYCRIFGVGLYLPILAPP